MALRLNGSTSGYTEIDAPASAPSNTLTLPYAGFGKILQVQQVANQGGSFTSNSDTSMVTCLTLNITPARSDSKILLMSHSHIYTNTGSNACIVSIFRGSTNLAGTSTYPPGLTSASCGTWTATPYGLQYLDSPATTSQITYTLRQRTNNSSYPTIMGGGNTCTTLTAIEVQI